MSRNPEQEQVAVNFVLNCMSEYYNGVGLGRPDSVVVPNGGAASDEADLARTRKALMAPLKWPVAK